MKLGEYNIDIIYKYNKQFFEKFVKDNDYINKKKIIFADIPKDINNYLIAIIDKVLREFSLYLEATIKINLNNSELLELNKTVILLNFSYIRDYIKNLDTFMQEDDKIFRLLYEIDNFIQWIDLYLERFFYDYNNNNIYVKIFEYEKEYCERNNILFEKYIKDKLNKTIFLIISKQINTKDLKYAIELKQKRENIKQIKIEYSKLIDNILRSKYEKSYY